jgi:hypothetical protein
VSKIVSVYYQIEIHEEEEACRDRNRTLAHSFVLGLLPSRLQVVFS